MRDVAKTIERLVERVPSRTRWSLLDQILISGVNVLMTVLLVRALGLETFGLYTLALIGIQYLAGFQTAGILSPMMSLYDQRGDIAPSGYLGAVLTHQFGYSILTIAVIAVGAIFRQSIAPGLTVSDFALLAGVATATQFQDLTRRYFYVTERAERAFACDLLAYLPRLAIASLLAWGGELSLTVVWLVTIASAAFALIVLAPDLQAVSFSKEQIARVTNAHRKMAGWLVGNNLVSWFSEVNFAFLMIGLAAGNESLGATRAMLVLIMVVNLLLQSLENFVPSAAAKAFVSGGGRAVLDYVVRIGLVGSGGILAFLALLMLFADSVMSIVYGQNFPNQLAILGLLGAYHAFVYITMIINAGLRAIGAAHLSFFLQVATGMISILGLWIASHTWGVIGALLVLLLVRVGLAASLAFFLVRQAAPPQRESRR